MAHRRFLATVSVLAFTIAFATTTASLAAELTFEDRVAAQEAIERVRYAHAVGATTPFEEAVPRAVIEEKVRAYLRLSEEVEVTTPITAGMLDREVARFEASTRSPDRLRELYAALANDPLRIAECLARPVLASRLSRAVDASGPAPSRRTVPEDVCPADAWEPISSVGAPSRGSSRSRFGRETR